MEQDELAEVEVPGFDADSATVFCTTFSDTVILQVTNRALRVVDSTSMELLDQWQASDGEISMACANRTWILLATAGRRLHLLAVEEGKVREALGEAPGEVATALGEAMSGRVGFSGAAMIE